MKLGTRLRALRESNNLTQVQLAKKLDITSQSLSQYELNKRTPDIEMINKLADFFNVSTDYLLGRGPCSIIPPYPEKETERKYNVLNKFPDKNGGDLKKLLDNTKNLTAKQIRSINALIEAFNNKK